MLESMLYEVSRSLNYSIYIVFNYIRLFLVLCNKIAESDEESMQKFTVTIHSLALKCLCLAKSFLCADF